MAKLEQRVFISSAGLEDGRQVSGSE